MSNNDCSSRVRRLHDWEIEEAKIVFADRLEYERVRVHECAKWPDTIHRLGQRVRGQPPPGEDDHNAITLGNGCYFPLQMSETLLPASHRYGMRWLIHELTHAWQFQRMGWIYLLRAMLAQLTSKPYNYEGENGLRMTRDGGGTILSYNPEQQGAIVSDYYVGFKTGADVAAWQPFINDIRAA